MSNLLTKHTCDAGSKKAGLLSDNCRP